MTVGDLCRLTKLDSRAIMGALEELRREGKAAKEDMLMNDGRWYSTVAQDRTTAPVIDDGRLDVRFGSSLGGAEYNA